MNFLRNEFFGVSKIFEVCVRRTFSSLMVHHLNLRSTHLTALIFAQSLLLNVLSMFESFECTEAPRWFNR